MTSESEEIVLDIVDIEVCVSEDRPVPRAHRYKYRVNKQHFISDTPELTREQILERAGLVPTDAYRLRLKRRHGPPEEIMPGQTIHLCKDGVERFIAQPKEVQDGLEARRDFALSEDDTKFLNGLQLRWEAVTQGGHMWIIIYGIPIPSGFTTTAADVAIDIAPGYPTSQLDMAYFNPPLALSNGKPIARSESSVQIDGKSWQRWSRHRTGKSKWQPGIDNLETHFTYMLDWLKREVEK